MKNSMLVSALFVALVVGGCAATDEDDLDDVSSADEGDEEIVESTSDALCLSKGGVVISFGKCKSKKTTSTTTRPGLPGKAGSSSSAKGTPGKSGGSRASSGADCCYNGSYFKCPNTSACFGGGTPFSPKGPPTGCTPSAPVPNVRCGG